MLMLEGKEVKTQEPRWTRALEVWGWGGELSVPWRRNYWVKIRSLGEAGSPASLWLVFREGVGGRV